MHRDGFRRSAGRKLAVSAAIPARAWRFRGTPAARLSAAIEVLDDIAGRRRPAADALKDWGAPHRFAGSGDPRRDRQPRLRRPAPTRLRRLDHGEDTSRAVLAGMLRLQRGLAAPTIAELFSGERFAPPPLTRGRARPARRRVARRAPVHVAGDVPDWVLPLARGRPRRRPAARAEGAGPPGGRWICGSTP